MAPMRVVMQASAIVLGLAYLWAAAVRGYVGWVMRWVRRPYWVSVPVCLALSTTMWWSLFVQEQVVTGRILLGRAAALASIPLVFTNPGLLSLRRYRAGEPER